MYTADGTLAAWLQADGAAVIEGEAVLEIETEKALQEVPAPASGRLHHALPVGTKLTEQMVIGYVLVEGEQAPADTEIPSQAAAASITGSAPDAGHGSKASPEFRQDRSHKVSAGADDGEWIKASPIARRLASERGIPLTTLHGSGPGGRIVEADVLAASGRAPAVAPAANVVIPIPWRVRERIPFTGIRRMIAERLRQSQTAAVSLTLQRELRAGKLAEARTEISRKEGVSMPFDAFFVKFLAQALRERPELNSVISGDELVLLDEVNVGFACSVPGGLVVPVIRAADTLSITDVGRRIRELTGRARVGQLKSADIEGGTSTITNLGGLASQLYAGPGFSAVDHPGIGRSCLVPCRTADYRASCRRSG